MHHLFCLILLALLPATAQGVPKAKAEAVFTQARLDVLLQSLAHNIEPTTRTMGDALAPGYTDKMIVHLKERFTKEAMKTSFLTYLQQNMTEAQADDILAWLSTPTGKALADLDAGAVMAQRNPALQQMTLDAERGELITALIEQREQLNVWVEMTAGQSKAIFHAVNHFQPDTIPQFRIDQAMDELRNTLANQIRPLFERAYQYAAKDMSLEDLSGLLGDAQSQRVIDYQTLITGATRHIYE